jgi:hypothetical protein
MKGSLRGGSFRLLGARSWFPLWGGKAVWGRANLNCLSRPEAKDQGTSLDLYLEND